MTTTIMQIVFKAEFLISSSFRHLLSNFRVIKAGTLPRLQIVTNLFLHNFIFGLVQDVRIYYRNAYLKETEESSKRAIVNMQRSDRYNQRNQEQSESFQDFQIEYRIDTEANRYERYNPNNFNHGE